MTARWAHGTIRGPATGNPARHCVVKIGGSLLGRPDWPHVLVTLLADRPSPLIVVGGGPVVDGLRAIDAASSRPTDLMHRLAIDAMTLTARLVADACGLPLVTTTEATQGVLDVAAWLEASPTGVDLPAGWHVTSDSIAAAVAGQADRGLLLAKLARPPGLADDLQSLAAAGWVDAWFPLAAASLTAISWATPT
jgi:aspartokinase-like uncharacterized kinase